MIAEAYKSNGILYGSIPASSGKGEFKERENKETENDAKMLLVRTKSRNITINKDDILYVESNRRKKEIHMTDGIIEIYSTMDDLRIRLGEGFYQCHRGYIVNMAHVIEYTCDSIKMSSGEVVYMSKGKYNGFENSYLLYLGK